MIFDIFQRLKAKHRHQDVRQGRAVNLASVLMDRLRQKEAEQHLSGLTPQRVIELFSNYRAGKYADVQLVWDELEEQDDTLKSIVDSRLGGLAEMPWRVSVRADLVGDNQELQMLAEQQQRYVESLLRGVDNLEEAIEHLGMADFRGYAALEVTGEPGHMRWEVIEPWNLARPLRNGPWLYNPEAQDSTNKLEELEMRRVILRETRRPIDLAAMFLIVEKSHGTHAWDAFLDTFGVPSIFFELPPNTSEEDGVAYDVVCNKIIAEGRGTLPSGTKVQTVETSQNSSDAYKTRAEWCRDALLTLGLGGTLTATAESGSGTLAGNAHADSLARLCARSARGISTAINRCFCWPEARKRFPGAPLLVEFVLSHEEEEDKQALATMFATLAGARYRAEDAVVSEHLGVEVTTEPAPAAMPGMMSRAEEGRTRLESREEGKTEEGEPLTAEELALMKQYGEAGSLDLGKLAGEYEKRLEEAARAGFGGGEKERLEDDFELLSRLASNGTYLLSSDCEAKDPTKCWRHGLKAIGFTDEEVDAMGEIGDIEPPPTVEEAKAMAKEALRKGRGAVTNNKFIDPINGALGITAYINADTEGAMFNIDKWGKTCRNLERGGICDYRTAKALHFAAASQVRTLFEEAVRATDQVVDDHGKRKKSEALHFYTPFRTKINGEEKYVVADISVITYQASDRRLIHCLSLTLEAPDDSRGRQLKRQSPSPRVK